MSLLLPQFGLFFWTLVIFIILLVLLRKFAWKPIMKAIHEREDRIESSLKQAEEARKEMESLKSENEKILQEARAEREKIIREANSTRQEIVAGAQEEAGKKAAKEIENARQEIEQMKVKAIAELNDNAAKLSVEIAEKILRKKLDDRAEQERFAQELVNDIKLN